MLTPEEMTQKTEVEPIKCDIQKCAGDTIAVEIIRYQCNQ